MEAKNVGVIKDVFDILEMHPPSVQPASHSQEPMDHVLDMMLLQQMEIEQTNHEGSSQAKKDDNGQPHHSSLNIL